MDNFKYNDDTLLHSVGFNPFKIESILRNGIYSLDEALNNDIDFSRNHFGYNGDNKISMTRVIYSNIEDNNSAYNKYVLNGVSFKVENQDFLFDKKDNYFNHSDEVYVLDKVPLDKITSIVVPDYYKDIEISSLEMIRKDATSYNNIKNTSDNLIEYLKDYNYNVDMDEYKEILSFMGYSLKAYRVEEDIDLLNDFNDSKEELDVFLAREVSSCFSKLLNKEEPTLMDVVSFINNRTLNLPIEIVKSYNRGKYAKR